MPRVHFVKKARKDNRVVKKGESYYYWTFRHGGKRMSKTRPRPSQLTQSEYYQAIRGMVEEVEDMTLDADNDDIMSDLEDIIEDMSNRLEELAEEQYEKKENMPEGLQEGPTGQLLEERSDMLESAQSDLDGIDRDLPNKDDFETDEEWTAEVAEKLEEIRSEMIEAIVNAEV